ncbi:hypothetical protein AVEN_234658-1 [Araneus ventricosus]|uniref:Uncharacterized protein n=1 Tax=Araneus ventricosus TaxID=182803 RepID=A0A4Y2D142_ARAVE|nr:hypothetical protein AVEN_234658-1 [Araneus ventricosus]
MSKLTNFIIRIELWDVDQVWCILRILLSLKASKWKRNNNIKTANADNQVVVCNKYNVTALMMNGTSAHFKNQYKHIIAVSALYHEKRGPHDGIGAVQGSVVWKEGAAGDEAIIKRCGRFSK